MAYSTIGKSDGATYDVVHEEIKTNVEIMIDKTVIMDLKPQTGNEPLRRFRMNYFHTFTTRRPVSDLELLGLARGEVVMFLEDDVEDWEESETFSYHKNIL